MDKMHQQVQAILVRQPLVVEKPQAGREIEERQKYLEGVLTAARDAIVVLDSNHRIVEWNPGAESLFGYSRNEVLGQNIDELVTNPDIRQDAIEFTRAVLSGKEVLPVETVRYRKDGSPVEVIVTGSPIQMGDALIGAVAVYTDITERKQAKEEIHQLNQYLENIIDNTNMWVNVLDEQANIVLWNKAAVAISGYSREEVVGHDKIWEWLYPDEEYRNEVTKTAAAVIEGRERHTDDETTIWCKDGQTKVIAWNDRSLVDEKGKTIGSTAIGRDITERKEATKKLRTMLEGVIQVIMATTETRDPYTAGHQERVTALACVIAKEMGLPDGQIEGLRFAGLIHDIGKIGIPAEILSKPTKLSEIEFSLIKTHPQVGHDVLKTIDFPWPVAGIVFQHHERMDGSGYPQGIKGDKIILEARILSVADVMEAMASHRPYRPAVGIDEALEQIQKNKGTLYDPEVVNACLKLFTEGRFEFESQPSAGFLGYSATKDR